VHERCELGNCSVGRDSSRAAGETLKACTDAAKDARRLMRQGQDPIDERDRKRDEARA